MGEALALSSTCPERSRRVGETLSVSIAALSAEKR
uniref:Uncharacterized protein n=1 Tax=Candidatus Giovannonibacteria bacterium GW2011_GWF2_42_19 TaxID=1618659 RepID=A0A0G0ZHG4_9BACT|nr:MAG: hypothetical protein UV11_C0011G0023 [Candidatus Giovannonibacteria bacterium GW2011_GWF2_42_19]